jgi:hypothetical protein
MGVAIPLPSKGNRKGKTFPLIGILSEQATQKKTFEGEFSRKNEVAEFGT